ncbi:hypothetical protein ACJ2A9_04720 [Anaerobacillus sp. MEB173]|uniref:hypothetical protein n=1 Tax=Anaerobacillus sp. MEB173 TaxID=3383345 RepID=UPI003F932ACE
MTILVITVFYIVIALLMNDLYRKMGWTVRNFEGKEIPYSLGMMVVVAALVIITIESVTPEYMYYISIIWLLGFIDDRYGLPTPKGLKGHFRLFLQKGTMTTGLLKVVGTICAGIFMLALLQPDGWFSFIRYSFLLLLTPHVMNLFDTRPLRVWKLTILHVGFFLTLFFSLPFSVMFFLVVVTLLFYIAEGRKWTMLGDNGATAIGAILSLLIITHVEPTIQWGLVICYAGLTITAEKISFTNWIEKTTWIKRIDKWGTS